MTNKSCGQRRRTGPPLFVRVLHGSTLKQQTYRETYREGALCQGASRQSLLGGKDRATGSTQTSREKHRVPVLPSKVYVFTTPAASFFGQQNGKENTVQKIRYSAHVCTFIHNKQYIALHLGVTSPGHLNTWKSRPKIRGHPSHAKQSKV